MKKPEITSFTRTLRTKTNGRSQEFQAPRRLGIDLELTNDHENSDAPNDDLPKASDDVTQLSARFSTRDGRL